MNCTLRPGDIAVPLSALYTVVSQRPGIEGHVSPSARGSKLAGETSYVGIAIIISYRHPSLGALSKPNQTCPAQYLIRDDSISNGLCSRD